MKTEIHIGGRLNIPEDEIILLEGCVNYAYVYMRSGEIHFVATTLKSLESRVADFFYRSHKKYIINLREVASFENEMLRMRNKKKALVSRRRREELIEKLQIFKPSVLKELSEV